MKDTIFALSTVFGKSGVAVFRLSGSAAKEVFSRLKVGTIPKSRTTSVRKIYDSDGILIDECLLIYFEGPKSFTGEDIVEIHTHGSIAVIRKLQSEFLKYFRHAKPGEFSLRAFYNGKMNLDEVENLADLIAAETFKQVELAAKLKSCNTLYSKIHDDLISLCAFVESCIDFSEDVDEDYVLSQWQTKLDDLISSIEYLSARSLTAERLSSGVRVAILGSPNSGKSTLLNYLAKRNAAIVSGLPGTTRDIIDVHIDLFGYPVTFSDTAGIRLSSDQIESEGIKRTMDCAENTDIKIILFENGVKPDDMILNMVDENTLSFLTKCDSFCSETETEISKGVSGYMISVKKEIGTNRFFSLLKERVEKVLCVDEPFIIRSRHLGYLEEALSLLYSIDFENSPEIIAFELSQVCKIFENITGKIVPEDVLTEIFARFCIGK